MNIKSESFFNVPRFLCLLCVNPTELEATLNISFVMTFPDLICDDFSMIAFSKVAKKKETTYMHTYWAACWVLRRPDLVSWSRKTVYKVIRQLSRQKYKFFYDESNKTGIYNTCTSVMVYSRTRILPLKLLALLSWSKTAVFKKLKPFHVWLTEVGLGDFKPHYPMAYGNEVQICEV